MKTLHVIVSNKVATYLKRDGYIVCGNADNQIEFTFDKEWDAYERKTARFIWGGKPVDVEFSGNVCPVPIVANTEELKVGVYVENLSTTTSAVIPCRLSVLCDSKTEAEGKVVIPEGTPVLCEATITEDGEHYPGEGYDGFYKVTVKVAAEPEEVKLQEKTATENGEVTADSGYDGLSKVTVNVPGEVLPEFDEVEGFNVFLDEADEGTITVAYSTPQDVKLSAPSGSASAVRLASIDDDNFIPSNIKNGVNIFGLTGEYEGEGEVIPEISEPLTLMASKEGAEEGELVIAYNLSQKSALPAGTNAPLGFVKDDNFIPSNIKNGVNIFGLTGTNSTPAEISTEAEMTALLTSGEVGGVYKYTGTTGAYDNGALYVLADSSGNKFWRKLRFENEEPYLTFSSPSSFTLNVVDNKKYWDGTLEYSTDLNTWSEWDGTTTLSADSGKLYMRGTGNTHLSFLNASTSKARWVLEGSEISCIGNIENLLDYETVARGRHPAMAEDCYCGLFYGCTGLTTAPELPATTLTLGCYADMFRGCTSLVTAPPALPATIMADYCYYDMFRDCTSLTTAPELPATVLAKSCYEWMFSRCTGLTTAPSELPATTLTENCYRYMFRDCTSLTTAPELPATVLAKSCYEWMFAGCTNLTTAPSELPATTLTENCYVSMFQDCTSLTTAPELPATTLASHCYYYMFAGCTNLTTAPELPATTLTEYCYDGMFHGCTNLVTAPALPATTLTEYCYASMFRGCTSLVTAPELPATTLTEYCYAWMFSSCTGLTTAPELPATTLASHCYYYMFAGCTNLVTAPALPATTLTEYCYDGMFHGCTNLVTAPALPATTLTLGCYADMFRDCTSLVTAPKLPATELISGIKSYDSGCYADMFYGCTSLKLSTEQTEEYTILYRIPTSGEGTMTEGAKHPLTDMFASTGGTFTGTPEINTIYYLHTSNTVV